MAKRIREASYRSGDVELTVANEFIYEVNLYVIYLDRVCLLYTSDWFNDDDEKAFCREAGHELIENMLRSTL